MKTLEEISILELQENWEEAINSLEERLNYFPLEKETILRLMFLYLYLNIEDGSLKPNLSLDNLSEKMYKLFNSTKKHFQDDAEYQWILGLMISFYELDPGWYEELPFSLGKKMMEQAKVLSKENHVKTFDNRGYLGKYFSSVVYKIY